MMRIRFAKILATVAPSALLLVAEAEPVRPIVLARGPVDVVAVYYPHWHVYLKGG